MIKMMLGLAGPVLPPCALAGSASAPSRRQKARIKRELGGFKIPFGDHIGATRYRTGEPNRGEQEHQRFLIHDISPLFMKVWCGLERVSTC